ncbi:MAG: hypothetical protein HKP12_05465 [Gammaproteobacteria bacterium]|nr:hypothetical protein [Gammaproteobacteria bacterium]
MNDPSRSGGSIEKNAPDALVVWAGTLDGGADSWLAVVKPGARFGKNIGRWGAVARGLVGATLSKKNLEASPGL